MKYKTFLTLLLATTLLITGLAIYQQYEGSVDIEAGPVKVRMKGKPPTRLPPASEPSAEASDR